MTNFVFTNFFSTTLSAAVLSTATTITVSSSANLPTLATGQVMPIVLTSASNPSITEICYVTAIGGTTLTVERAQEGTGALAWSVGDFVSCDITAQSVAAAEGNAANQFAVATATSGSNAVNYSQFIAAIGGFSGIVAVSTSEQLSSSAYGNVVQIGASGITITLPANNGTVGQTIWFYPSFTTGSCTINCTGSGQFIYAPTCGYLTSNTSIPVNAGEWLCIMSRGNGEFDVVAGSWLNNHQNSQSVEFYAPIQIPNGTSSNQAVALGQLQQVFAKNGQGVTSANTTLTAADAGQIITVSGSTAQVTITLPSSNASATGNIPLVINNASSYPVVVAAPSGDNLSGGSIGTLQPNQSMFLFNDGSSTWITLANEAGSTSPFVVGNATASNQAVALGQFPSSLGTSGYQKLANGLIIQWGIAAASTVGSGSTNTVAVTFPIAFPTAILFAGASAGGAGVAYGTEGSSETGIAPSSTTLTGMSIDYSNLSGTTFTYQSSYLVIGY